jgi:diketogulonate reductase-like aldo/keto reductase
MKNKKIKLNNGYSIPCIGYGTYKEEVSNETVEAIKNAIKNGYRMIDTASRYGNEKCVGEAIKGSKIKRKELFITSKLWGDSHGYSLTIKAFKQTLKDLNLKYLDLYLIHWPVIKEKEKQWEKLNVDTWRAMEFLYNKKLIRAIGVSNFKIHHLKNIIKNCKIMPMVNQIENHPGCYDEKLINFCHKNKIIVQAYAPLACGKINDNALLIKIGKKYNKTPAQVSIRWNLQHNIIPLPKSTKEKRIIENFDVFDFKLTSKEMKEIDNIKTIGKLFPDSDFGK